MGALTGTLTYKQYYVEGQVPDGFRDAYLDAIRRDAFREIDIDNDESERYGWALAQDLLDAEFRDDKVFYNQYLILTLRHDAIKVPASTLKIYLQREEREVLAKTRKERLSKFERDEIRDRLTKQLRRKTLPTIRAFDLVWNLDSRTLLFWSHNKRTCELFEELFERTFSLRLVPHNTYCALSMGGVTEATLNRVVALEPVDLLGVND